MNMALLRAEISSKLSIFHQILASEGSAINEGEQFTARIFVYNSFAPLSGDRDYARFTNVRIGVEGTQFAEPVQGNRTIDLGDVVPAGRLRAVDVQFTALLAVESFVPWMTIVEPFVQVTVRADFDYARFFQVEVEQTLVHNIKP